MKLEQTRGAVMQTVIIDTDIAIDYLRGISYALDLILPLWENNTAHLSILSVYELYSGLRDNERKDTEHFMAACNIDTVTFEAAQKGGELYRHYREKGITLTSVDCLIAATAITRGHKIATKNTAHYPDKKLLLKL